MPCTLRRGGSLAAGKAGARTAKSARSPATGNSLRPTDAFIIQHPPVCTDAYRAAAVASGRLLFAQRGKVKSQIDPLVSGDLDHLLIGSKPLGAHLHHVARLAGGNANGELALDIGNSFLFLLGVIGVRHLHSRAAHEEAVLLKNRAEDHRLRSYFRSFLPSGLGAPNRNYKAEGGKECGRSGATFPSLLLPHPLCLPLPQPPQARVDLCSPLLVPHRTPHS